MGFLGGARTAVLAAAVVAEVTGPGRAVFPALAVTPVHRIERVIR